MCTRCSYINRPSNILSLLSQYLQTYGEFESIKISTICGKIDVNFIIKMTIIVQ